MCRHDRTTGPGPRKPRRVALTRVPTDTRSRAQRPTVNSGRHALWPRQGPPHGFGTSAVVRCDIWPCARSGRPPRVGVTPHSTDRGRRMSVRARAYRTRAALPTRSPRERASTWTSTSSAWTATRRQLASRTPSAKSSRSTRSPPLRPWRSTATTGPPPVGPTCGARCPMSSRCSPRPARPEPSTGRSRRARWPRPSPPRRACS